MIESTGTRFRLVITPEGASAIYVTPVSSSIISTTFTTPQVTETQYASPVGRTVFTAQVQTLVNGAWEWSDLSSTSVNFTSSPSIGDTSLVCGHVIGFKPVRFFDGDVAIDAGTMPVISYLRTTKITSYARSDQQGMCVYDLTSPHNRRLTELPAIQVNIVGGSDISSSFTEVGPLFETDVYVPASNILTRIFSPSSAETGVEYDVLGFYTVDDGPALPFDEPTAMVFADPDTGFPDPVQSKIVINGVCKFDLANPRDAITVDNCSKDPVDEDNLFIRSTYTLEDDPPSSPMIPADQVIATDMLLVHVEYYDAAGNSVNVLPGEFVACFIYPSAYSEMLCVPDPLSERAIETSESLFLVNSFGYATGGEFTYTVAGHPTPGHNARDRSRQLLGNLGAERSVVLESFTMKVLGIPGTESTVKCEGVTSGSFSDGSVFAQVGETIRCTITPRDAFYDFAGKFPNNYYDLSLSNNSAYFDIPHQPMRAHPDDFIVELVAGSATPFTLTSGGIGSTSFVFEAIPTVTGTLNILSTLGEDATLFHQLGTGTFSNINAYIVDGGVPDTSSTLACIDGYGAPVTDFVMNNAVLTCTITSRTSGVQTLSSSSQFRYSSFSTFENGTVYTPSATNDAELEATDSPLNSYTFNVTVSGPADKLVRPGTTFTISASVRVDAGGSFEALDEALSLPMIQDPSDFTQDPSVLVSCESTDSNSPSVTHTGVPVVCTLSVVDRTPEPFAFHPQFLSLVSDLQGPSSTKFVRSRSVVGEIGQSVFTVQFTDPSGIDESLAFRPVLCWPDMKISSEESKVLPSTSTDLSRRATCVEGTFISISRNEVASDFYVSDTVGTNDLVSMRMSNGTLNVMPYSFITAQEGEAVTLTFYVTTVNSGDYYGDYTTTVTSLATGETSTVSGTLDPESSITNGAALSFVMDCNRTYTVEATTSSTSPFAELDTSNNGMTFEFAFEGCLDTNNRSTVLNPASSSLNCFYKGRDRFLSWGCYALMRAQDGEYLNDLDTHVRARMVQGEFHFEDEPWNTVGGRGVSIDVGNLELAHFRKATIDGYYFVTGAHNTTTACIGTPLCGLLSSTNAVRVLFVAYMKQGSDIPIFFKTFDMVYSDAQLKHFELGVDGKLFLCITADKGVTVVALDSVGKELWSREFHDIFAEVSAPAFSIDPYDRVWFGGYVRVLSAQGITDPHWALGTTGNSNYGYLAVLSGSSGSMVISSQYDDDNEHDWHFVSAIAMNPSADSSKMQAFVLRVDMSGNGFGMVWDRYTLTSEHPYIVQEDEIEDMDIFLVDGETSVAFHGAFPDGNDNIFVVVKTLGRQRLFKNVDTLSAYHDIPLGFTPHVTAVENEDVSTADGSLFIRLGENDSPHFHIANAAASIAVNIGGQICTNLATQTSSSTGMVFRLVCDMPTGLCGAHPIEVTVDGVPVEMSLCTGTTNQGCVAVFNDCGKFLLLYTSVYFMFFFSFFSMLYFYLFIYLLPYTTLFGVCCLPLILFSPFFFHFFFFVSQRQSKSLS